MKRVRNIDVARAAEVSTATVSNALRGTGYMTEQTRKRVREVALALGHPLAVPAHLAPTRTLGLGVTTWSDRHWNFARIAYYAELIGAATASALSHGYGLVVLPADADAGRWRTLAADGVLLVDSPDGDPIAAALREAGMPLVFSGRPVLPEPGDTWVDNDHALTTRLVLDHLAARGARRVGLIAGPAPEHYSQACIAAYLAWCAEHDRAPRIATTFEGMYAAAEQLIRRGADAIYGIYDSCGHACLSAARDLGRRVPEDLLIACMSEDPSYASTDPAVTTVSLSPRLDMARAVHTLVGLVAAERTPASRADIPATLHPRASTLRR